MAIFSFRRKIDVSKEFSLKDIPLFASLTPSEQKLIKKKARLVEFKRGDMVYKQGTPSEALYVVISGRFRMYEETASPGGETLFFLYRGEHFGEASLLAKQNHSVSVEAKRDGLILRLERDDFLKFVTDMPVLSQHLNRSLGHRLMKSEDANAPRREVKVAALYDHSMEEDGAMFWMDLSGRLGKETTKKVIIVDFAEKVSGAIRQEFGKQTIKSFHLGQMNPTSQQEVESALVEHPTGFSYIHVPCREAAEGGERRLGGLLTFLTYRFDFVMLKLVRDISNLTSQMLKRTDFVYVYCPPEAETLSGCSEILGDLQQRFGFGEPDIRLIVPENGVKDSITHDEKERLLGRTIFSVLPSRHEKADRYQGAVRFISRELAGKLIGIALGSGAAYGLAHIGVIKILEREKIPIDVISGSSIGALIGAYWAAGFNSDDMARVARSINRLNAFFKLVGFRDLSLAHHGFIKGNQVTRFMESYFGNLSFQDLRTPLRIVATNLFDSEEVVFEGGRVVDALRASISIPGIFRPFSYRGEHLIDGGVIDPLPVSVLSRMGVKKIIAVNVLSSPKDRQSKARAKRKVEFEEMRALATEQGLSRTFKGSLKKIHRQHSVNIFNVIMNTIQFMEYELALASAAEADVLIHPQVEEGHWAQFYTPDKFIKAGEQRTLEKLDEIRQLLAE